MFWAAKILHVHVHCVRIVTWLTFSLLSQRNALRFKAVLQDEYEEHEM